MDPDIYSLIDCSALSLKRHHFLYLHVSWSQYPSALPKQSKFPSFSCFLWIVRAMTSLKQGSQRDDVKSSGPQDITESFSHSRPHLIHFTRILLDPFAISILMNSVTAVNNGRPVHAPLIDSSALLRKTWVNSVEGQWCLRKGPICLLNIWRSFYREGILIWQLVWDGFIIARQISIRSKGHNCIEGAAKDIGIPGPYGF